MYFIETKLDPRKAECIEYMLVYPQASIQRRRVIPRSQTEYDN